MLISELIQRSPIRIFEQSIKGGLGPGELGVIAAPSGIGKTSVLVQIALDKLLQGKKVIHISFTQHTDYVLTWYENIFNEFIRKKNLENEQDVKDEIVKNRVLMKFTQGGISGEQVLKSIKAMIKDGGFSADVLIVDGYDFSETGSAQIATVKSFAAEMGVSVWFSCTVRDEKAVGARMNIPLLVRDYADLFAVIIVLNPKPDHITLTVSRDRDASNLEHPALKLDPRTLLIMED